MSLWPEGISDGLVTPCVDCGETPRFDYNVTDDFWEQHVKGRERTGVICLPCLDRRCGGAGLSTALTRLQWTGTGHTVVFAAIQRHVYPVVKVRIIEEPGKGEEE